MGLEDSYTRAQKNEDAVVAKIRKACAAFMATTPDYYAIPDNEATMFRTMQEHDELNPASVAGWSECFALCRDDLKEKPATRRQSRPTQGKRLSHDDIDRMTSVEYLRRYEGDPSFAEQVNALGPRK
jgi:hypothetical protein